MQSNLASTFRISQSRRAGAGFTLLEILLTLALIGLLGAVLIGGSAQLLNEKPAAAQDVFWQAVREARKTALKAEHDIRLKFDRDRKRFVVLDGLAPTQLSPDGIKPLETSLKEFPVVVPPGGDLDVSFLSTAKGGLAILVGGVLLESQPLEFVTFYSDGTCSPFRLQIMRNGAAGTLSIDPWTCAPVLTPSDSNSP